MGLQPQHRQHHVDLASDPSRFPQSHRPSAWALSRIHPGEDVFPRRQLFLHGHRVPIPAPAEGENSRSNFREKGLWILARKSCGNGHHISSKWKSTGFAYTHELWETSFALEYGHSWEWKPREVHPHRQAIPRHRLVQIITDNQAPSGWRVPSLQDRVSKNQLSQIVQDRGVFENSPACQQEAAAGDGRQPKEQSQHHKQTRERC